MSPAITTPHPASRHQPADTAIGVAATELSPETWCRADEAAFIACAVSRGWRFFKADVYAWDYSDKAFALRRDLAPEAMAEVAAQVIEEDEVNA